MKATDLIKKQHKVVDGLFKQFENAKGTAAKVKVFEQIAGTLCAHDGIEREIFYPACEDAMGSDDDMLKEAVVEHGLVEFCIFTADRNRAGERFESHVEVLQEIVEHHVDEEEDELLPKAAKKLGAARDEELGVAMEAAFAKKLAADFRKPILHNLTQVLQGRDKPTKLKTAPNKSKGRASRTPRGATPTARKAVRSRAK